MDGNITPEDWTDMQLEMRKLMIQEPTTKRGGVMIKERDIAYWKAVAEARSADAEDRCRKWNCALERIATLESRLAECEKDAERLEWCAENKVTFRKNQYTGEQYITVPTEGGGCEIWPGLCSTATVREAIDAAINQSGLKPGDSTDGVEG